MKLIYGACCGKQIGGYGGDFGPNTKGWNKPSSCPVCGKDGKHIDYRRRIIVRDDIAGTIELIEEPAEAEVPEPKVKAATKRRRGGFRP